MNNVNADGIMHIMEMDGGQLFGPIPETEWERYMKADRRNSAQVSVNTLLVRTPNGNMLTGAGVGGKRRTSSS